MIPGLDISHLNSPASLQSLYDKGIRFIYFKATQSNNFTDPTFNESWQEAKSIKGLARGCYHFFDPRVDGKEQAEHFLSTGASFTVPGALMPCVDVEDLAGSDAVAANKWVLNNWHTCATRLTDFLNHIKAETGRDCMIYTYNNYMREYYNGVAFPNNPMWLSSLQATCPNRYDTRAQPQFWQYTYGWQKTDMDGNWFMGTQEQLNTLANL